MNFSGVGPITVATSNDPAELQGFFLAVQNLVASGGGDFPEFALDGMLQGLQATQDGEGGPVELMVPGSQMIVLTDATSQRPEIVDLVITEAINREVCIHFFVSNSAALSDGIYQRIATETTGTLIENFENFQLASFIAATAINPCGFTFEEPSRKKRSDSSSEVTFDVSVFTILIQLSISANSGATVSITRPGGGVATVVASVGFAVFSEGNPEPGTWSVHADSGNVEASVTQTTTIDTTILYIPEGSDETTPNPPEACKSIMSH